MNLFLQRLAKLARIIGDFKQKTMILFVIMILAALSETIGISIVFPILSVFLGENIEVGIGSYFAPLKSFFSKEYLFYVFISLFMMLMLLKCFFQILVQYLIADLSARMCENWRNKILDNYLSIPYFFILNQKQGNLINNLVNEPGAAAKAIINALQLLTRLILAHFIYFLMWLTSWRITLILSVVAIILFLVVQGTTRKFSLAMGKLRLALQQKLTSVTAESIMGMRLVRTYSLEKSTLKNFGLITRAARKVSVKFAIIKSLIAPLTELFIIFLVSGVLIYFQTNTQGGIRNKIAELGVIIYASQRLFSIVSDILSRRMSLDFALPSLGVTHDSVHNYPEKPQDTGEEFTGLKENIIFKDISFSYQNRRQVFNSLSLEIPKDKITALIGPSGIGKSTFADLFLGLASPSEGQILINGKPLETYNINSWKKRIGFVSQDTIIFNITIGENIRLGNPNATDEEIVNAAKIAAIHDFISALPDGYNTEVGERGLKLSGGQRQRIAIARAIIRNPDIYIFDEATSSLDFESEDLIKKSIQNIGKNKTVIIITHRLNTIENADVVYDLGKMEAE